MTATKRRRLGRTGRILLSLLSAVLAGALIWALPYILNLEGGWSKVADQLLDLTWWQLGVLLVLWLAGLWSYTYMLKATLPGLTNLQAFTMNACSSGLGNMLPFGGAAGVAVNFALCRSWGYPRGAVAASTLVSGIWNVLIRLLVPAFGLVALLLSGVMPGPALAIPVALAAVGIIAVAGLAFAALEWDSAAKVVGRWLDRIAARLPHRIRPAAGRWSGALWRTRAETSGVIKKQWPRMSGWLVFYFALQAALFIACTLVTGAYVGFAEVFAAFAIGRLATAIAVTPGGTGFTEAAASSLLIAFGALGGAAAAAALLFSALVFFLEIPLGAILWVISNFLTRGRWSPERTAARVGFDPVVTPSRTSR